MAKEGVIELVEEQDAIWSKRGDPDLRADRLQDLETTNSVIMHTTGYGLGLQRLDKKLGGDAEGIDAAYGRRMASILQYKPTFLVGRTGRIFQFAPVLLEDGKVYRTHHTGGGGRLAGWKAKKGILPSKLARYAREDWLERGGKKRVMTWWPGRFEGLDGPLELPCWEPIKTRGAGGGIRVIWSANMRSAGTAIDLLSPRPGEDYTKEQAQAAARLVAWITLHMGVPYERRHIIDHSEAHPWYRSNRLGAWDFDKRFGIDVIPPALSNEGLTFFEMVGVERDNFGS